MKFEFEGFNICEVGQEQRRMQTSKKVNNILTEVRVFGATRGSISFELLHVLEATGILGLFPKMSYQNRSIFIGLNGRVCLLKSLKISSIVVCGKK